VGAFAHIAAKRIFPDADVVGYPDFRSAYMSVQSGECDLAVLPLENSFNGDVAQVMDLTFFGDLYISGVYDIGVVHNLLAKKGAKLSDIKTVISHSQAIGQCASFIQKHNLEAKEVVNTAVAAKLVSESDRLDIAAIASSEAAEEFNLCTLSERINDSGLNTTRFAVFAPAMKSADKNDKHFVLTFTVSNEAGALGKAVLAIGENGFNLRALKSRPTKELIWDYYFYAEGEGNLFTPEGEKMLKTLKECCSSVKVVGSFEKELTL
jgi:chorismate mutase/prephenate dehydratase